MRTEHNPVVFGIEQTAAVYPELSDIADEDKNVGKMFKETLKNK